MQVWAIKPEKMFRPKGDIPAIPAPFSGSTEFRDSYTPKVWSRKLRIYILSARIYNINNIIDKKDIIR